MNKKEIKPEQYYPLHQIFKMGALPWIKSFRTLRKMVTQDIEQHKGKKFKAIKTGHNQGTRYNIKGIHLIELIDRMNREGFTINEKKDSS